MVVSVAAGGVVVCSIPCSPSVPDVSVFLLQPSANRSAHVNTRTRVTANIFFIPLSPPSGYRIFVRLRILDFTRRLRRIKQNTTGGSGASGNALFACRSRSSRSTAPSSERSEEHTSELQSQSNLV